MRCVERVHVGEFKECVTKTAETACGGKGFGVTKKNKVVEWRCQLMQL